MKDIYKYWSYRKEFFVKALTFDEFCEQHKSLSYCVRKSVYFSETLQKSNEGNDPDFTLKMPEAKKMLFEWLNRIQELETKNNAEFKIYVESGSDEYEPNTFDIQIRWVEFKESEEDYDKRFLKDAKHHYDIYLEDFAKNKILEEYNKEAKEDQERKEYIKLKKKFEG